MMLAVALLGAMVAGAAAQPVVRDHRAGGDAQGGVHVGMDLEIGGDISVGGDIAVGGGRVVVGGSAVVDGNSGDADDADVGTGADLRVAAAASGDMVVGGLVDPGGGDSDDPLATPHWELSVGMLLPVELIGDGPTLAVQAGRQVGPVRLAVDYARYARISAEAQCPYAASRLGVSARYRVSLGLGIAAVGAYVEGGFGREVARHDMTRATTPSVLVGVGVEALFGAGRSIGFDLGYRMHVDTDTEASVSLVQLGLLLGGR